MSLKWTDAEAFYSRDTGVLAKANEDTLVGILPFGAPLEPGTHQYEISLEIAVQSHSGTWYDWGVQSLSGTNHVEVLSTYPSSIWSTEVNPTYYYDKLNERLDEGAVSMIIAQIQEEYPGDYGILQICEAYQWVHSNVEYVADASDYWQSAEETMSSLTGDCEDQAILMATLIKGLGGNARLNIISGHAFPTVFVAENESNLKAVEASINSYYWTPSGSLRINYLNDELGYWLVVDTAGEPYVGGLPALSRYASTDSAAGYWSFSSSSFLITVDATGKTSSALDLF
jgi:transglutaminase-like putative cysteine protease